MAEQCGAVPKQLPIQVILTRPFSGMRSLMSLKSVVVQKGLFTFSAFITFFSTVNIPMFHEVSIAPKRFSILATLTGLFSCMNFLVANKRMFVPEDFPTLAALKTGSPSLKGSAPLRRPGRPPSRRVLVLGKGGRGRQALPTIPAREGPLCHRNSVTALQQGSAPVIPSGKILSSVLLVQVKLCLTQLGFLFSFLAVVLTHLPGGQAWLWSHDP